MVGEVSRRRLIAVNRSSMATHSSGAQPARAVATALRRVLTAVSTFAARWPLIPVDPVEFVEQGRCDPGSPELPDCRSGRFAQGGASAIGELEPAAGQLRQSAGLQQQPGECRDRLIGVEVATVEHFGDHGNGRGGWPAGGLASPQPPTRHQVQYGAEVGLAPCGGCPDGLRHRGRPVRGVRAGWSRVRVPRGNRSAAVGMWQRRRVRRCHEGRPGVVRPCRSRKASSSR
jgi:hypothetical protein